MCIELVNDALSNNSPDRLFFKKKKEKAGETLCKNIHVGAWDCSCTQKKPNPI